MDLLTQFMTHRSRSRHFYFTWAWAMGRARPKCARKSTCIIIIIDKASVSCKRVSGHPPACYFGGRLFWPLLSLFGTAHAQFNYQN